MENTNLLVGKVSSGKTKGYMFHKVDEQINRGENLLILDNKREYYTRFKDKLDENGYRCFMFNLEDTTKSNSYNPLLLPYQYYKNGNKDKAISLIQDLGLEIFKSDNNNVDPFWDESATNYFMALVLILFKEASLEEINLGSVQAMIRFGEEKIGDSYVINKYFEQLDILDSIYISGSAIVFAPMETRGSILSVMKQKLNNYCVREQLMNNLCGNEISFSNIHSKTAIFVIGAKSLNRLANIFIDQAVEYFTDNNINFTYILDNFSDMPKLLGLDKMLNEKLKLYVVVRDLEQFKFVYGEYMPTKFEHIIDEFVARYDDMVMNNEVLYPESVINHAKYFNLKEFVMNH